MKANFAACLDEVLSHEGGYVNHPSDPGGETDLRISKRSDPETQLAWAEAVEYRRSSPAILALAAALELTDEQVDTLAVPPAPATALRLVS